MGICNSGRCNVKITKILLCLTIGLVAIGVINMGDSFAQQGSPPEIKVYLALDLKDARFPNQPLYFRDSTGTDRIKIVLTFINRGDNVITSKGFSASPFHLYLTFTDPDENAIIAKKLQVPLKEDALPPETIDVNEESIQVDPVETLVGSWTLPITIPDAHAFYALSKGGRYSVSALIPMRTYLNIDHVVESIEYSELDKFKWEGAFRSNTVNFILLVDADGDGYYIPEGYPSGAPADCNDNDAKEKPGQIWYKDADNDGYSDGTTNNTSCTRPSGFKTALELTAAAFDCNDADPNDVPVPRLSSPPDGATNISTTPTLSWNPVNCATSYGLQVSISQTDWSGPNLKVNQSGIVGTSQAVSGLANGTLYYWRVNATNAGGTSAWSSPWSFTTTKKTYDLTVTKAGTGFGTVTAEPPDNFTWDGSAGTGTYEAGTKVTLTAYANTGSTFTGWSAYCSGSGNCSVVISGSKCTVNMCGPCNATVTFTAAPPTKSVRPVLECVVKKSDSSYIAWFGYLNENAVPITIPVGPNNKFTPTPIDRGQTTVFEPGRKYKVFSVPFNGSNLVWTLKGPDGKTRTSTASRNSARCK